MFVSTLGGLNGLGGKWNGYKSDGSVYLYNGDRFVCNAGLWFWVDDGRGITPAATVKTSEEIAAFLGPPPDGFPCMTATPNERRTDGYITYNGRAYKLETKPGQNYMKWGGIPDDQMAKLVPPTNKVRQVPLMYFVDAPPNAPTPYAQIVTVTPGAKPLIKPTVSAPAAVPVVAPPVYVAPPPPTPTPPTTYVPTVPWSADLLREQIRQLQEERDRNAAAVINDPKPVFRGDSWSYIAELTAWYRRLGLAATAAENQAAMDAAIVSPIYTATNPAPIVPPPAPVTVSPPVTVEPTGTVAPAKTAGDFMKSLPSWAPWAGAGLVALMMLR